MMFQILQEDQLSRAVLVLTTALALGGTAGRTPLAECRTSGDPHQAIPFAVGERLVYRVEWNPPWYLSLLPPIEAGVASLSLDSETRYKDRKAFKIIFSARSSGALVRLFGVNVDDHYEFVTDPETFCTFKVTEKIRERKKMRDVDLEYLPDTRQLHMREVDVSTAVPNVIRDKIYEDIPPCVQDLFSALYGLRRTDLSQGTVRRVLVGDDARVKEIEIRVEKSEQLYTPAGPFRAWQVNTVSVFGGLFKSGGQFRIWLSADDRKLPVKFEAKVSLGKVTGSLKEVRY